MTAKEFKIQRALGTLELMFGASRSGDPIEMHVAIRHCEYHKIPPHISKHMIKAATHGISNMGMSSSAEQELYEWIEDQLE